MVFISGIPCLVKALHISKKNQGKTWDFTNRLTLVSDCILNSYFALKKDLNGSSPFKRETCRTIRNPLTLCVGGISGGILVIGFFIYVDASKQDQDTELGRLMHDLNCRDAADMQKGILAERVRWLKETERGVEHMCREMDEIYNEAFGDGKAEGRAEGRVEGRAEGRTEEKVKVVQIL